MEREGLLELTLDRGSHFSSTLFQSGQLTREEMDGEMCENRRRETVGGVLKRERVWANSYDRLGKDVRGRCSRFSGPYIRFLRCLRVWLAAAMKKTGASL